MCLTVLDELPMIAISGLFVPIETPPPALHVVARALPLTYAVNLLKRIWNGGAWITHTSDIAAPTLSFLFYTVLSTKILWCKQTLCSGSQHSCLRP
jgi:ABC-2 type transport system permease protein